MHAVRDAFWQRSQEAVLAPYAERYLQALRDLGSGGMIPAMATSAALFPVVGADAAYLDRLAEAARAPEVNPVVRRTVVERVGRAAADARRPRLTACRPGSRRGRTSSRRWPCRTRRRCPRPTRRT